MDKDTPLDDDDDVQNALISDCDFWHSYAPSQGRGVCCANARWRPRFAYWILLVLSEISSARSSCVDVSDVISFRICCSNNCHCRQQTTTSNK